MAQQVLEQSGVKAFVMKDDAGGMEPHLQRSGGVRLLVDSADAESASKIFKPSRRTEPSKMPRSFMTDRVKSCRAALNVLKGRRLV